MQHAASTAVVEGAAALRPSADASAESESLSSISTVRASLVKTKDVREDGAGFFFDEKGREVFEYHYRGNSAKDQQREA